jgi:hypothetical protein
MLAWRELGALVQREEGGRESLGAVDRQVLPQESSTSSGVGRDQVACAAVLPSS